MPSISYFLNRSGNLAAKWPGTTSYSTGKPRKTGQIYIGLVVDKERGIFWNRSRGYVMFNQESLTFTDAPLDLIPARWREVDQAKKESACMCGLWKQLFSWPVHTWHWL